MKELAALKMVSDALTISLNAMATAQKINALLSKVQAENREISDEEFAAIHSDVDNAFAALRAAIAAK